MLFLIFLVVAFCSCSEPEPKLDGDILVLTQKNFVQAVTRYSALFVEFYAPWCGHCKSMEPQYIKAAAMLREQGSPVRLAKVDATVETKLADDHEVKGFPTFYLFKNGSSIPYNGNRSAEGIVTWLNKKMGPSSRKVDDIATVKLVTESEAIVVFGLFKNPESESFKQFSKVADEHDELTFIHTHNEQLFGEHNLKNDDAVIMFRKFDEPRIDLDGDIHYRSLVSFVKSNQLPIVIDYSSDISAKLFSGDIKNHTLFFVSKKAADFEDKKAVLGKFGKLFKGKLLTVLINIDDEENAKISEYFGIQDSEFPTYRFISLAEDIIKYKPEKASFDVESLSAFAQSVIDGTMRPHLRSEEPPVNWEKQPVKVLVQKNFDDVIAKRSKNIFVKFYAPWCGHCKQLAPIWSALGETFKDSKDTMIAKIDVTANDLEHEKVKSFPTLKYYPVGSAKPIVYEGNRTLEALKKFVSSYGKDGNVVPSETEEAESEEPAPGTADKQEKPKEEL